jgi:hypothetical protein
MMETAGRLCTRGKLGVVGVRRLVVRFRPAFRESKYSQSKFAKSSLQSLRQPRQVEQDGRRHDGRNRWFRG